MMLCSGPLIRTKYIGPTNHRCSRITASHKRDNDQTWRATLEWDNDLDAMENAKAAALALIETSPMAEWQVQLLASGYDQDHYYFIASSVPTQSTPA
jgi:hypothetical protein